METVLFCEKRGMDFGIWTNTQERLKKNKNLVKNAHLFQSYGIINILKQ